MSVGRLADPNCTLGTDPRSDPRMVAALAPLGLADVLPDAPLTLDSPLADRLAYAAAAEQAVGGVMSMLASAAPAPAGVTTTTVTIPGADGQDITLFVSRPDRADGPLPAVVHFHGGAMAIASAA
ncbi:MAG: alpha/beta hydrolase, partial [Mycolicibacterium aromaticivorans]|nr:alpha/beta hydrolase [Mycolicibacterium aromaticivorans]